MCDSHLWPHETDLTPGLGGINWHKYTEVNISGWLCFGAMGDRWEREGDKFSSEIIAWPPLVSSNPNEYTVALKIMSFSNLANLSCCAGTSGQAKKNKLQAIKSPRFQGKTNQIIWTSLEVRSRLFLSDVILYTLHWPAMTSKADRNQSTQVFYQSCFWLSTNKPTGLNHLADVKFCCFLFFFKHQPINMEEVYEMVANTNTVQIKSETINSYQGSKV